MPAVLTPPVFTVRQRPVKEPPKQEPPPLPVLRQQRGAKTPTKAALLRRPVPRMLTLTLREPPTQLKHQNVWTIGTPMVSEPQGTPLRAPLTLKPVTNRPAVRLRARVPLRVSPPQAEPLATRHLQTKPQQTQQPRPLVGSPLPPLRQRRPLI